jgi:sterol desaturase/sphingolipid hydroxylase (fatty acid hydroxylase superfamily)
MIGIPIALGLANGIEWAFHRYVLHGLGRRKDSFFHYHFAEHHRAARAHGMRDEVYHQPLWRSSAHAKEVLLLAGAAGAVLPLFPVAPFFVATSVYCAANYYRVHRRSHTDPAWGRKHAPWHVAHHLGNQNKNWCVTKPWFDRLMGTATELRIPSSHRTKTRRANSAVEVAAAMH